MMSLRGRAIVLALVGAFVIYPLWWAQTQSPQAQRAKTRATAIAGGEGCRSSSRVVRIRVSVSKYPDNWRHIVDARAGRNTGPDGEKVVDDGLAWPRILVKNDQGEDKRRAAAFALSGLGTRPGKARDEYPPAEGRSTQAADIRYVPLRENSAQGASMGGQLRKWCNGTRYELVAAP